MRTCSIDGCERKHKGHGYCLTHLRHFKNYGDPLKRMAREKGSGAITGGYIVLQIGSRRVLKHVLMVENVLGRRLPVGAVVHHIDGDALHNENSNFVVCPSQSYHILLHTRQRALEACGNPNWRSCGFCGVHDEPGNLKSTKTSIYHSACKNRNERERYART